MKLDINKINLIKVEKSYTNVDISKKTNISQAWLSTILNRGYASPIIVNKLSKGLNVPAEEILLKE